MQAPRIDKRTIAVSQLMIHVKNEKIVLPEVELYEITQLFDFILARIPLNPVYFNSIKDDRWNGLRGYGALASLNAIINKGYSLTSDGMNFSPELSGKTWNEIPRDYQRRVEEYTFDVYILESCPSKLESGLLDGIRSVHF